MSEVISREQKLFKHKKMAYIKPKKKESVKDGVYGDSFIEYFNGRGISEKSLKEVRITQEVEFIPQEGKKCGCIAFNYYVGEELVNVKHRSRNKGFKLVSGAKLVPYNINSIAPESYDEEEEKSALFCEGEIDALTYIECGFHHVVSVPNGASTNLEYMDDFIDSHFDKLDTIYVSVDNDKKGLECRAELLRRFGDEKCKIVDYPKPCKDINEVLMKYGADEVVKCVKNAKDSAPDGLKSLYDVESEVDFIFKYGFQKGATIGIPSIDNILSFKTGLLHIVTGVPSHGKSFMLNYLLVMLNKVNGWKSAFFSPEFYPVSHHIAQTLETLGGKRFSSENYNQMEYEEMKRYLNNNFFFIDPNDTDINSVMNRARYLIKKRGIKAFVIDPFNALTDSERKSQKQDEYISEFLQKLRWFGRKYDVAVFIVMHPTKVARLENGLYPVCDLYNCKGASEINDKADVGITVWRNKDEDYAELHVVKMKFRNLGKLGHATLKFNINNGRFVEIEDAEILRNRGVDIRTMQADWDNSNYVTQKISNPKNQVLFQQEPNTDEKKNESVFAPPIEDCPF